MSWPSVAQRVKDARLAQETSQKRLADFLACSPQYINDIERGRRSITAEFAQKLEFALHIRRGELVWLAMVEWAGPLLAAEAFISEYMKVPQRPIASEG